MLFSRTRTRFRYEGDQKEVVLDLDAVEARTIADALLAHPAGVELGERLDGCLRATDGPGGDMLLFRVGG